uniref:DNA2/NAM7 helicase helicase domain-containing protein n=1 Tax=Globodera rostochiensis TaxID=31243 RepID=A0A914I7F4_GLORO
MSKRRRMDTTEPALSDSTQEMMDTEDSPKKIPIFSLSPLHPVKSLGLQARELPNFSFKPITKPSPSPGNTGKSPTSSGSNVPGYEDLSPEIIVLDDPGPAPSRQHKNSEQTTPPPLATANVRLVSVLDFPDGDKTAESISSLSSSINWEEIVAQAWGLPMSDSPGPGPEEKSENPPHTNPTPSSLTEQVLKSTLISLLDPTGSSNFLSPQENTSAPPPASSQTSANAQPTSKTQGIQRRPSPTPSPPFENKGFSNGSAESPPPHITPPPKAVKYQIAQHFPILVAAKASQGPGHAEKWPDYLVPQPIPGKTLLNGDCIFSPPPSAPFPNRNPESWHHHPPPPPCGSATKGWARSSTKSSCPPTWSKELSSARKPSKHP